MTLLLPTAYFPPVSYLKNLLNEDAVQIEGHEHYVKQSIRNRCEIFGANGRLRLTVPVEHNNRWRLPIKEIRLRNDEPWKRLHLKSIRSAYGKSPFFEYYEEELEKTFEVEHTFLFEWNYATLQLLLKWLKVEKEISFTDDFLPYSDESWDARMIFDRSENEIENNSRIKHAAYYQVFESRHGFQSNLSCMDLIFNTGPDALHHLQ
jgi:hypothetical protein